MNDEFSHPQEGSLQRLIRGLLWIGTGLLIGAALAIIWAVFQTRGVDDFLTALTVAGLGFGLPSVVAFSIAWLLSSFESAEGLRASASAAPVLEPPSITRLILGYVIALGAVGLAWAIRVWLSPLLAGGYPFVTFTLAIAVAGWLAGLGPALLATIASLAVAWFFFVSPTQSLQDGRFEDVVAVALFAVVGLGLSAITSGLRTSRDQARRNAIEAAGRNGALEQARNNLAQERDRFHSTLSSIGEAVITTDENGAVTYMNPAAEQMTGWKSPETVGALLSKVMHIVDENTGALAESPVTRVLQSGKLQGVTHGTTLVARNGRELSIEDSAAPITNSEGKLTGVAIVFRDASEQRRARAALEESEQRFRALADQAPALMWMSDANKARVFFNRTWLEFTGKTLAKEQGEGWTASVHPEDYTHCLEVYNAAIEKRQPFAMEYRLRRHDGEYRWVYDQGAPRSDAGSAFSGYIGACMDITERKEARATPGSVDRRRSEFIATLAHELRNPLAPIRNAVQIIARLTTGRDPRLDHAREVVDRQSERLTALIDDLLDIARIDTGKVVLKREAVALQDVVNVAVERTQHLIRERGHALNVVLPPMPVWLDGDRARLAQVLTNLLNNAAKFTPDGGQIDCAAQVQDHFVEIVVADNGMGIDPGLLPDVFDLFDESAHAARQSQSGLGLGLTIVRRLVEMHGGSVAAASGGPGSGARFTVRLPIVEHGAETGRKSSPASKGPRILVVDDNVDAAVAIATLLEMSGYAVTTVHDPRDALQQASGAPFDVIVLDIGLPGMTGYELAGKLRAPPISSRAKLVALTGYGQSGDETPAKAAGFSGYLVKPVDADQLTALVSELTRRDRGIRRA